MQFDKPTIKQLRHDINDALAEVAAEYGVVIRAGNCTFSDSNAKFKLSVNSISDDGVVLTQERTDLMAAFPNMVDKCIRINDEVYMVYGYKRSATKYPFMIKHLITGRRHKCSRAMAGV